MFNKPAAKFKIRMVSFRSMAYKWLRVYSILFRNCSFAAVNACYFPAAG